MAMAFDTVGDIFDFLKNFHRDLAAILGRMKEDVDDEKKRMLLNFIGRHQKYMEECVGDVKTEVGEALLRAWIKNVSEFPKCRCFETIQWNSSMSVADLVEWIKQVDDCLLKLYRQLADKAPTPEVRELFEEMLAREKSESSRTLAEALNFLEQD